MSNAASDIHPGPDDELTQRNEFHLDLPLAIAGIGAVAALVLYVIGRPVAAMGLVVLVVVLVAFSLFTHARSERTRLLHAIRLLKAQVLAMAEDPTRPIEPVKSLELYGLARALEEARRKLVTPPRPAIDDSRMTRSGMFEPPGAIALADSGLDPTASGDMATLDMVNRLDHKALRWLESSPAEQEFLGWPIAELRQKSFLEVVHPDDRNLASEQLQAALIHGEAHGLIYRIRTARGETKSIEMNVSVRYGADMKATHLRCHVADVTAKVRASKELRRRTRELTLVNEQLRKTNRELQELKNRYSDLYQNAPAMYFSLDEQGFILECNNTLLRTLGYQRNELIGRPYTTLLTEARRPLFIASFAEFLRVGSIEVESRWKKASGEVIDVWVTGTAVLGPDGKMRHSRSVAQDVTPRRTLEAALKERNERLARTNDELSIKNRELDEFTYVVSHDLQEPLRTLIHFSDFLLKDYGQQIDEEGKEFIRHLVEASRRMRALITDLLSLSRAGRVTGDFSEVNVEEAIELVKFDLAELIRTKNAEVRVVAPLPRLWADRGRVVQLLSNLIGNGLKYNQNPRPTVEISSVPAESDDWATLAIRDNGIGIDAEFHDKIFQIFRRLHAREEYEGTGAGLAICQKIVQAHGGRIWVESKAGQGATFYITLPRHPANEATLLPAGVLNAT